jgi:hypothetical protein
MSAKDFAEQHDGQQVEIDNRPGEGPFIVRGYASPDRVVMEAPATWKGTGKGYNLADLGRRHYGTNWTSVVPVPGSDTRFCLRPVRALTVVASAAGAAYAAATTKPFHQQFAEQYDGQQVLTVTSRVPRVVRGYCVHRKEVLLEVPNWSGMNVGYSLAQITNHLSSAYSILTSQPTDAVARFSAKSPQFLTLASTGVAPAVQVQQATPASVNVSATASSVPEHVQFFNDHADEEVEIRVEQNTRTIKARVIGCGDYRHITNGASSPMILLDTDNFRGRRGNIGATLHDTIRRKVLENAVLSPGGRQLDPRMTMTVIRMVSDITLINNRLNNNATANAMAAMRGSAILGGPSMQHPATPVDRVTRDSMLRQVFCGPPAPKPKQIDEYPGICPRCKGPAYVSALTVDCKARCH